MSENQRKFPRLPLDVEVDFKGRAMARSKNISKEGICLVSEDKPEKGKILNLSFILPSLDKPVQAYARVMWIQEASEHFWEFGLKFWEIDEEDEKRLNAYFQEDD